MKERRARLFEIPAPDAGRLHELAAARRARSVVLLNGTGGTDPDRLVADLARAIARPVNRVPLARVVGKYIGETEKNLARAFVMAERAGAVLLFDEADALFGKRSEVRDSHDRYANQQAGHLLAMMEQYDGIVLLATNQPAEIDPERRQFLLWVISTKV